MISNPLKNTYFLLVFLLFFSLISCNKTKKLKLHQASFIKANTLAIPEIIFGAQQTEQYLKLLTVKILQ